MIKVKIEWMNGETLQTTEAENIKTMNADVVPDSPGVMTFQRDNGESFTIPLNAIRKLNAETVAPAYDMTPEPVRKPRANKQPKAKKAKPMKKKAAKPAKKKGKRK